LYGASRAGISRAARTRFEPLRIRLNGSRDGILRDLSESGALLVMALALPRDDTVTVNIEWRDAPVVAAARVARSEQRQVQLESATMARKDYNVALEFLDLTPPRPPPSGTSSRPTRGMHGHECSRTCAPAYGMRLRNLTGATTDAVRPAWREDPGSSRCKSGTP
jgi:hypothetical protein